MNNQYCHKYNQTYIKIIINSNNGSMILAKININKEVLLIKKQIIR